MLRLYPRLTSGNQFGMDEDTVLEILKKRAILSLNLKNDKGDIEMEKSVIVIGGGPCTYTESGIKSCQHCTFPHQKKNYDAIIARFREIAAVAARSDREDK